MFITKPARAFFILLFLAVLLFLMGQVGRVFAVSSVRGPVQQLTPPGSETGINAPGGGEALQGMVTISGTTDITGFRSAEIAFAYPSDLTGTWFLIQNSSAPVREGLLASWDTTTIADGVYRLRLQVFLLDGRVLESEVSGLRVRNYSPVETITPGAGQPVQNAQVLPPTPTPTAPDYQSTPRPASLLPTNPAQVTPKHLQASALSGVAIVIGAFVVAGIYLGLRALARR